MTTDDSREQAMQEIALVTRRHVGDIARAVTDALADAGLLAGTANTTEAEDKEYLDALDVIGELRAKVAKLRAELTDANLDREHAQEVRKQANERADAYNEAHRKTLDRTRRVVKERDHAVADLAALRDKVRALADAIEAGHWGKTWQRSNVHGALRALLTDGGQS